MGNKSITGAAYTYFLLHYFALDKIININVDASNALIMLVVVFSKPWLNTL